MARSECTWVFIVGKLYEYPAGNCMERLSKKAWARKDSHVISACSEQAHNNKGDVVGANLTK